MGQALAARGPSTVHSGYATARLRWQTPPSTPAAQDLAFVPFALLGAIGGLALYQRLNNAQFHVATSALLLVSGAGLLACTF